MRGGEEEARSREERTGGARRNVAAVINSVIARDELNLPQPKPVENPNP